METGRVDRPVIRDYGETLVGGASGTNTGSSYAVDISTGNTFNLILNDDCTFSFTNPPASGTSCFVTLILTQDGTGGREATWPAAVRWSGGVEPTLSAGAGDVDIITFTTVDGGTIWHGFLSGNDFRAAQPYTLSFVASAESAAATITIPSSAAVGDLAVLFDYATGNPTPTDVVPTNWTGVATANSTNLNRLRVSYKIIAGGEPGSSVTGMDSTAEDKVMLVFRGDVPINTVTASTWNAECTAGNPADQSVTALSQDTPLIVLGMAAINAGTAAFDVQTPAFTTTVANSEADILAGYRIYNASPVSHTIGKADQGADNGLASGYLICS
jgi:hypothetical protein